MRHRIDVLDAGVNILPQKELIMDKKKGFEQKKQKNVNNSQIRF